MSKKGFIDKARQFKDKHSKILDLLAAGLAFAITFTIFFYLARYFLASQVNNF